MQRNISHRSNLIVRWFLALSAFLVTSAYSVPPVKGNPPQKPEINLDHAENHPMMEPAINPDHPDTPSDVVSGKRNPAGKNLAVVWAKANQYYLEGLKENNIIGSSFMIIHGGKTVVHTFQGYADLETGREVDELTIYHWASITKTFTGIAIMQLRDLGLLDLSDPVIKYIPQIKQVHNPFGMMDEITIEQIMSHSAGFRDPTWPWGGDKDWHPYEPLHWSQLEAMFPYTEILFKPGSKYSYSNPAIIFLGRIIELISGDDYEVYIDKNILKPLGMYQTYFDITPVHLLKYRSNSYYIDDNKITARGLDFDTGITTSNGGLNAPLPDMAKYLCWLAETSESDNNVLKRRSLQEMWRPKLPVENQENLNASIGLTFFIYHYGGKNYIGHRGEQMGFISFIQFFPGTNSAAMAVFNSKDIVDTGISRTNRFSIQLQEYLLKEIWPTLSN